MWNFFCDNSRRLFWAALAAAWLLGTGDSLRAEKGQWTFRLEPMVMDAYGHDRHVLTIRRFSYVPQTSASEEHLTAVQLATDPGDAYRGELRYTRGKWGLGLDVFSFETSQGVTVPEASGSQSEFVTYEAVGPWSFFSSEPSSVLFFHVLKDTDLTVWAVDLYGMRTVAERPKSALALHGGVRFAGFENDYRMRMGARDLSEASLDASASYDLLTGPMVGLAGEFGRGRSRVHACVGQSLLFGEVEQVYDASSYAPWYSNLTTFRMKRDATVAVTDLRVRWTFALGEHFSLGTGVHGSWWSGLTFPPTQPSTIAPENRSESSLVFFGVLGTVGVTF